MSTDTMHWYPSKVDWWLALVLCVPPVASVTTCVALALGGKKSELTVGIAAVLIVVGIYVGLVFPICYWLDDTHLVVRFGVCPPRIPFVDTAAVRRGTSPLSLAALTLT